MYNYLSKDAAQLAPSTRGSSNPKEYCKELPEYKDGHPIGDSRQNKRQISV